MRGIEFFFKVKVKTRIGVLILGFIMFIVCKFYKQLASVGAK